MMDPTKEIYLFSKTKPENFSINEGIGRVSNFLL
jgi:hypothetical protein